MTSNYPLLLPNVDRFEGHGPAIRFSLSLVLLVSIDPWTS